MQLTNFLRRRRTPEPEAIGQICDGAELLSLALATQAAQNEKRREEEKLWVKAIHEFNEWVVPHIPKLVNDAARDGSFSALLMSLPGHEGVCGEQLTGPQRRVWDLCTQNHITARLETGLTFNISYTITALTGSELIAHWGQEPFSFDEVNRYRHEQLMEDFKNWPKVYLPRVRGYKKTTG